MIINHNLPGMNAINRMNANSATASKSMQKLSSGLRINTAADDAAGLAISEKMRGQIRGLDTASANAQDGISMIQTAEGALNETQSILQRMRELATQAANDTNVSVDRDSIQKEMNQLSSEINRIGNTTEFNTQKLLQGDGKVNLDSTGLSSLQTAVTLSSGANATSTQVTESFTASAVASDGGTATFSLNGQTLTLTFATATSTTTLTSSNAATVGVGAQASQTASTNADAIRKALQSMIDNNSALKGNYTVTGTTTGITITANADGAYAGAAGTMGAAAGTTGLTASLGATVNGTTTAATNASASIDFSSIASAGNVTALLGKGITINGQQIEFYNANAGAYTGDAVGVNISDAITATSNWASAIVTDIAKQVASKLSGVTLSVGTTTNLNVKASEAGTNGNSITATDGGVQKAFEATFQVGANQGQGFDIEINDMRSIALKVTGAAGGTDSTTGASFTSTNTVTNGTDTTLREASLDVSTNTKATNAIKTINNAIEAVSAERSKLGAYQNRLEHTINNLGTSSENLTSAESRIRDVDMAKEMSTFSKNNILSQAAQAMLAQANQQPQQVLQLLR